MNKELILRKYEGWNIIYGLSKKTLFYIKVVRRENSWKIRNQ